MNIEPIGFYRSALRYRFETPRQSVFIHNSGVIELQHGRNFETALEDLEGFDRIWVLFQFHLNDNWRPKVRPPVAPENERIGVFATRSPHRPNPIGLSCVKLEKIEGLKIFVQDCDLLDESPVFDIKPYIPAADSFPDSRVGWLERAVAPEQYEVVIQPDALAKILFLKEHGFDAFSTTLLVSPYQKHELIIKIANEMAEKYGVKFIYQDFREGFRIGQQMARDKELYMQKYCGCIYSEYENTLERENRKLKK